MIGAVTITIRIRRASSGRPGLLAITVVVVARIQDAGRSEIFWFTGFLT